MATVDEVPPPVPVPPVLSPTAVTLEYTGKTARRWRKPRVWPVYVLLAILLAAPYVIGIGLGILLLLWHMIVNPQGDAREAFEVFRYPGVLLSLQIGLTIVNVGLVLGFQFLSRFLPPRIALFRRTRTSIPKLIVLALGAIGVGHVVSMVVSYAGMESKTLKSIHEMIESAKHDWPLLLLFCIGVVAPIGEELIFRGYMQPRLIRRHGPWVGIAITSVMFGVFHQDLVQGVFAAGVGVYLGVLAYRTGGLLAPILGHMALNSTSVLINYVDGGGYEMQILLGLTVLMPILAVVGMYLLYRMPYDRATESRMA